MQHAEKIMVDISGNGSMFGGGAPAKGAATELLRKSNYFDCGRDQICVSAMDVEDEGQKCVVGFVNADEKEWVNGAGRIGKGEMFLAVVGVGVFFRPVLL